MRSKWKGLNLPLKIYKLSLLNYYLYYKDINRYFYIKRSLMIFNFLTRLKFYVYNGRRWLFIYIIIKKHVRKKFGEFFFTKKRSLYLSKRKLKKLRKRKKKQKTKKLLKKNVKKIKKK